MAVYLSNRELFEGEPMFLFGVLSFSLCVLCFGMVAFDFLRNKWKSRKDNHGDK